jgi:peptide/nickel transport system permease protein
MKASTAVIARRRFLPVIDAPGMAKISAAVIIGLALVALAAPLLAPYDPNEGDLQNVLAGSSAEHPLGTDANGRDVLSRLIYGARTSLIGALLVVIFSTAIGLPLGLLAGYRGGLVDASLARGWDVMLAFPPLVLTIAIIATFGSGFWTAVLAITLIYVPLLARVIRGAVLIERAKPYVDACRVRGFSSLRIVSLHVLPNIAPILLAQATLNFGFALLDLAGLAFIGLGVQPPTADWGQMLATGRESLVYGSYQEVVSASLIIIVAVIAFNIVGDALAARAERVA